MSFNDEEEDYQIKDESGYNGNSSPSSNRRNLSPARERERSRSRSYEDRRRSGGNSRRSRSRSRRRSRRSENGRGGNKSVNQLNALDRDLGLKYRWEKTVYVSNIPYETRWPDLKDLFRSKVGDIMYCEVFEKDNRSLGVGAIEFKTVADAERAVEVMHQHEISGRKISVRIDHEGYKTRQAKEMAMDGHHKHSSSNGSGDNSAAALALALNQATTLASLTGGAPSSSGLLGLLTNPLLAAASNPLGTFGGANPTAAQSALLNQLASQLKVDGPVTSRIFVASLDYKVDESKIKEVFALSGVVQTVSLFRDRDGKSRGMAVVEYDTPYEALNAVAMFNNQQLMDRQMTVRFDTKPPKEEEMNGKSSGSASSKLPSGLKSIGNGLTSLLSSERVSASSASQSNNLALGALNALSGLSQSHDLSALANFGISLNGTAPSLGGLFSGNGTNGQQSNVLLSGLGLNGGGGFGQSRNSNGSNGNSSNTISKVFVKNIPFSWDERKLKEKFRQAGYIEYAEIKVRDGKSRGCGLIRFSTPDQAVKAVAIRA